MKQKTTTTLDNNTLAVVSYLSNAEAGKLFKAIIRYAIEGIEETFGEGELRILFLLFKKQIDSDNAKHKQTSETNSSNAKGRNKVGGKSKHEKKASAGDTSKETVATDGDDGTSSDDDNDGSDINEGKPPEQKELAQPSATRYAIVETGAVAENKAVAENGTVAKNPAIITADSGIAENNSENDGLAVQEENLSFDVLEALYPKKDLTAAYRQTSVNEWNVLSAEYKLKAIDYIQTNLNDGTATFNDMFLSQFLKKKPWL